MPFSLLSDVCFIVVCFLLFKIEINVSQTKTREKHEKREKREKRKEKELTDLLNPCTKQPSWIFKEEEKKKNFHCH